MSKLWHLKEGFTFPLFLIWFQSLVSSLDQKIDETEKKFEERSKINEERLKQAIEAETTIVNLKTAVHEYPPYISWSLNEFTKDPFGTQH